MEKQPPFEAAILEFSFVTTPKERIVLDFIAENPDCYTEQINEHLRTKGLYSKQPYETKHKLKRPHLELQAKGLITYSIKMGRAKYWRLSLFGQQYHDWDSTTSMHNEFADARTASLQTLLGDLRILMCAILDEHPDRESLQRQLDKTLRYLMKQGFNPVTANNLSTFSPVRETRGDKTIYTYPMRRRNPLEKTTQ